MKELAESEKKEVLMKPKEGPLPVLAWKLLYQRTQPRRGSGCFSK